MPASSGRHNNSSFIWPFSFENCGMEEKKFQKVEYLKNEKGFSDETKSIFHNFWNAFFLVKNKNIEDKNFKTAAQINVWA